MCHQEGRSRCEDAMRGWNIPQDSMFVVVVVVVVVGEEGRIDVM